MRRVKAPGWLALSAFVSACGSSEPPRSPGPEECDACLSALELAFVRRVAFTHLVAQVSTDSGVSSPEVEPAALYPMLYFPDSHGTLNEVYTPVPIGGSVEPPCSNGLAGVTRTGETFVPFEGASTCRWYAHPELGRATVGLKVSSEVPFPYAIEDLNEPANGLPDHDWVGSAAYTLMSYLLDVVASDDGMATESTLESHFTFSNDVATLPAEVSSTVVLAVADGGDVQSATQTLRVGALVPGKLVELGLELGASGEGAGTLSVGDTVVADVSADLSAGSLPELFDAFVVTPREGFAPAE